MKLNCTSASHLRFEVLWDICHFKTEYFNCTSDICYGNVTQLNKIQLAAGTVGTTAVNRNSAAALKEQFRRRFSAIFDGFGVYAEQVLPNSTCHLYWPSRLVDGTVAIQPGLSSGSKLPLTMPWLTIIQV